MRSPEYHQRLEGNLLKAARELCLARAAYRHAVMDGDLRAAIKLSLQTAKATIQLDKARSRIEGLL